MEQQRTHSHPQQNRTWPSPKKNRRRPQRNTGNVHAHKLERMLKVYVEHSPSLTSRHNTHLRSSEKTDGRRSDGRLSLDTQRRDTHTRTRVEIKTRVNGIKSLYSMYTILFTFHFSAPHTTSHMAHSVLSDSYASVGSNLRQMCGRWFTFNRRRGRLLCSACASSLLSLSPQRNRMAFECVCANIRGQYAQGSGTLC